MRARQGVAVGEERLNIECPGVQTRGVSAAGCIVAPAGCTANFIFGGPGNWHIGTAAHCVDGIGDELVMQVDTTTLASVGTVVARTGQQEPGNDFALIRIDPGVAAKWGVSPAIPVIGGPSGTYTGCGPVPVLHYGHGYGVAVAQGKPEGGIAADWSDDAYAWARRRGAGRLGQPGDHERRPGGRELHPPGGGRLRRQPGGNARHEDDPVRRPADRQRERNRHGRRHDELRPGAPGLTEQA